MPFKKEKIPQITPEEFAKLDFDAANLWLDEQYEILQTTPHANIFDTACLNILMVAAHDQKDDPENAAAMLLDLIETKTPHTPQAIVFTRAAQYASATGQYQDAINVADKGLNKGVKSVALGITKCEALLALGRYGEFNDFLKIGFSKRQTEKHPDLAYLLAQHACNRNRPDVALDKIRPFLLQILQGRGDFKNSAKIAALGVALTENGQEKSALRRAFANGNYSHANPAPYSPTIAKILQQPTAPENTALSREA